MENVVLYCKSYYKDIHRIKNLFESIKKHNVDKIPFYVSVPHQDIKLFQDTLGTIDYTLLTDEEITNQNLWQSWKQQQIVKMMFWKLNLSTNYDVIDSDAYFIKDFQDSDFIHHDDVPYTIMHEQKDLFGWSINKTKMLGFDPMLSFANDRRPIMDLFDRKGRLYDFGSIPVIWSSLVWKTLEDEYIKPNNLSFEGLINTVSSEFTWYGEWLLVRKPIELWPIEHIFKGFHYLQQYQEYKQMGYTEEDWAKLYFGFVMQSSAGCPMKY